MNSDEIEQFKRVIDSETGLNGEDEATVEDKLHHPSICPRALYLATEIWQAIREIEGVKALRIEIADCIWENQAIELPR